MVERPDRLTIPRKSTPVAMVATAEFQRLRLSRERLGMIFEKSEAPPLLLVALQRDNAYRLKSHQS